MIGSDVDREGALTAVGEDGANAVRTDGERYEIERGIADFSLVDKDGGVGLGIDRIQTGGGRRWIYRWR